MVTLFIKRIYNFIWRSSEYLNFPLYLIIANNDVLNQQFSITVLDSFASRNVILLFFHSVYSKDELIII